MIINFILFIALVLGIVVVTRNMMISSIRKIAVYLRWDTKIVGKIFGYATSMPELLNAFVSASIGMISTSIYNVISSNIINVVFVLISTFICKRTKSIIHKKFIVDYIMTVISILIPITLMKFGIADKLTVIPLFIIFYLIFIYISSRTNYFKEAEEELEDERKEIVREEKKEKLKTRRLNKVRKQRVIISFIILFSSFVLLYILGDRLSIVLETLGKEFKVPEIVLGIIIGIATSLPELLSFFSSYKRHSRCTNPNKDKGAVEVINNLVASNVANLCIIQTLAIIVFIIFS